MTIQRAHTGRQENMENEAKAYIYSQAFGEGYDEGYQDGRQEERERLKLQLNQLLEKLKNGGAKMDEVIE